MTLSGCQELRERIVRNAATPCPWPGLGSANSILRVFHGCDPSRGAVRVGETGRRISPDSLSFVSLLGNPPETRTERDDLFRVARSITRQVEGARLRSWVLPVALDITGFAENDLNISTSSTPGAAPLMRMCGPSPRANICDRHRRETRRLTTRLFSYRPFLATPTGRCGRRHRRHAGNIMGVATSRSERASRIAFDVGLSPPERDRLPNVALDG
jgi:hypothetical protein